MRFLADENVPQVVLSLAPRLPPRSVQDAQDRHGILANPVVDHIRIAYEWQTPHLRPLFDPLGGLGVIGDVLEGAPDARFDMLSSKGAAFAKIAENLIEFGQRKLREDEPHRRCLANTASTSSSVASSPRRTAASASSIFASSSRVAR